MHTKCLEPWFARHLSQPKCPCCNQDLYTWSREFEIISLLHPGNTQRLGFLAPVRIPWFSPLAWFRCTPSCRSCLGLHLSGGTCERISLARFSFRSRQPLWPQDPTSIVGSHWQHFSECTIRRSQRSFQRNGLLQGFDRIALLTNTTDKSVNGSGQTSVSSLSEEQSAVWGFLIEEESISLTSQALRNYGKCWREVQSRNPSRKCGSRGQSSFHPCVKLERLSQVSQSPTRRNSLRTSSWWRTLSCSFFGGQLGRSVMLQIHPHTSLVSSLQSPWPSTQLDFLEKSSTQHLQVCMQRLIPMNKQRALDPQIQNSWDLSRTGLTCAA